MARPFIKALILSLLALTAVSCYSKPTAGLIGKPAPETTGLNQDGRPITLADFRGQVIVLDFWATWCGPCKMVVPYLKELQRRHEDGPLAIVGVSADQDRGVLKAGMEKEHMTWPSFWDEDGSLVDQWLVEAFPTLYLIDHRGVVRQRFVGVPDKARFVAAVERLLQEAGPVKR